jgi:hypothetical protein
MSADVLVDMALAIICFASNCYPALVGVDTPRGEYQLRLYRDSTPGYGGDVLLFKETNTDVFLIHRVIEVPGQYRSQRLKSGDLRQRVDVTNGCINVDPATYKKLVDCCYSSKVIIK